MRNYKRTKPLKAIQFTVAAFEENPERFPMVVDRASVSEVWASQIVEDRRYFVANNQIPANPLLVLDSWYQLCEGDYIVEELNWYYPVPKNTFERAHEEL